MNDYVITIDVDWSPDWAIAEVANMFIENNVKSTWFITHDSPEIRRLFEHPHLFEVGIHPNFNENSTHGRNPREILMSLKKIAPHAKSIRTHGLVQSSSLLKMIHEEFNLLYDASLFLPETPNIVPHEMFFSKTKRGLLRFPYFWEDDEEMYRPNPCFSFEHEKYHVSGLKIFCFHVIHIVLNSYHMTTYHNCKKDKNLPELSAADLRPYVSEGKGIGTLFREIVQFLSTNTNSPSQRISDLAPRWRASK